MSVTRNQLSPDRDALSVEGAPPTRFESGEQSATSETRNPSLRRILALSILAASAVFPALLAGFLTAPRQMRNIHIEAFRYGFNPERIRVNRGDRLLLTFSTRDTGQSFFLQDYDLHVVITPGSKEVEVHSLSRPEDPPTRETSIELTAGMPGWRGLLVSKSQFRNHTYNGPLHGTERGDLIVSPNYLLVGSLGLLCALPLVAWLLAGTGTAVSRQHQVNLFQLFSPLKKLAKSPYFQFAVTLPMLASFYFVVLAGLVGTKVSGRNAGPMVIWVLWLSTLILVLIPLGGRIWCLACPVPTLGEWLQRRRMTGTTSGSGRDSPRKFLGAPLVWPDWLRNPWPSVLFFLLLGTFSTVLVALPPASSWLLIGLAFLAIATSVFPEQRLFCRYLCPIKGFISLYSLTGRLMARPVSSFTCLKCEEHFCLTGSVKGWGCPYGLCMGEVNRNYDCGMCTECVKTCAYDNVALFWRGSGWDSRVSSYGEAWQAIVMFGLSVIYCIVNLGAWHRIRDWVDIVDKQNWRTFAVYGIGVWCVCLGVLPCLLYLLTRIGIGISKSHLRAGPLFRASSSALIPLGLACWMAFAAAMLLSMLTFVLQSLSDPFNWGWNLLGMAGSPWHILWAPAIPWLQVACVMVGAAYSLTTLYQCWQDHITEGRRAVLGFLPPASFLWMAATGLIWFFAG